MMHATYLSKKSSQSDAIVVLIISNSYVRDNLILILWYKETKYFFLKKTYR